MALKDLLVHVDHRHHASAVIDAAIALAQAHDAHLIGLFALSMPVVPGYIRAQIPEAVFVEQASALEAAAERARQTFEERSKRAGIRFEWRLVEGEPSGVLSMHGRFADVVVVEQRDPLGQEASDDPNMPDRAILALGRPVLVLPFAGRFPVIGERVLVAWDGSRLATRAINDALPLLVRAKQVVVMAINPKDGDEGDGAIPSADICHHLARHGVNAEAQYCIADDIGVGPLLLSKAADAGIDLIVTGAYGHARWREIVLGGVTRHMLSHMTVPVLMSH